MAEGTHIPGTPECGEWETQLADALDGLLKPEEETRFLAHKAGCPACAALYEAARKGREWLEFLSPEPEPPEWLLEKILATTGPGHAVSCLLYTSGLPTDCQLETPALGANFCLRVSSIRALKTAGKRPLRLASFLWRARRKAKRNGDERSSSRRKAGEKNSGALATAATISERQLMRSRFLSVAGPVGRHSSPAPTASLKLSN